jgi:FG-GAP-like repeat
MRRSRTGLALGALLVLVMAGWTAAFAPSSLTPASPARRIGSVAADEGSAGLAAGLHRLSDFNRDGFPDLVARDGAGTLWLYPGDGTGGLQGRRSLGTDWGGMTAIVTPGDVNEDGNADILARAGNGVLWLYPGDGASALGTRRQLATWPRTDTITNAADLNGDGLPDLLSRDTAGHLWLIPMSGIAAIGKPAKIGNGWNGYTILGPGDFSGDGQADILARDPAGRLWLYRGNGTGGIPGGDTHRILISGRWGAMTALVSPGNWSTGKSKDGKDGTDGTDGKDGDDLLARDGRGRLWLYPGDTSSGFGAPRQISAGWGGMTYIG